MTITDARESHSLRHAMRKLKGSVSLSEFLEKTPKLTLDDKLKIIEQAKLLLSGVYAHLPLKQAGHAVNPVQQLVLLEHRVSQDANDRASISADWFFHTEMLQIFKGLRDVHTQYKLPPPFRHHAALLPFAMEDYFVGKTRHFMVSKVQADFHHATFRPGVEVTHWNGTPIERAVQVQADREEGSNPAARFAIGMTNMTQRPLATQLPPDEEWVIIRYNTEKKKKLDILLPWTVWDFAKDRSVFETVSVRDRLQTEAETKSSINERVDIVHTVRKHLFARGAVKTEERIAKAVEAAGRKRKKTAAEKTLDETDSSPSSAQEAVDAADVEVTEDSQRFDASKHSRIPTAIQFRVHRDPKNNRPYGYIRLRSFRYSNPWRFVTEFRRVLHLLPMNGLILDVRSNGGGRIDNGELLLQLLTPRKIEPAQFQFINTAITAKLCSDPSSIRQRSDESARDFAAREKILEATREERQMMSRVWGDSIRQSNLTGAAFSVAKPLTSPWLANRWGQAYYGPVVLITDAQCYSATDIFAAGFQDHSVGKIIGVDDNTGAGGANVWSHRQRLVPFLSDDDVGFRELPRNVEMSVSIRRSLRVGPRFGQPLEDLGVAPDFRYHMTKRDLLEGNPDLLAFAVSKLEKQVVRNLRVQFAPAGRDSIGRVACKNISRVDVYYDDRPVFTQDIRKGEAEMHIPFSLDGVGRVEVFGYQHLRRKGRKISRLVAKAIWHPPRQKA